MDNAIPFPKPPRAFKVLTDDQRKKMSEQINLIKKADAELDAILPRMIEAITAGDNVAIANSLLKALRGARKKPVEIFLKAYLPHEFREDGLFGKRLDRPKVAAKERAYRKWLERDELFSAWSQREVKVERKPTDYRMKLKKDVRLAMEKGGMTFEEILSVLEDAVKENVKENKAA